LKTTVSTMPALGVIVGQCAYPIMPGHVAEEIVAQLGLQRENVRNEIRHVSAWFDDELTKLEGAE
jgi:hypothetical protein